MHQFESLPGIMALHTQTHTHTHTNTHKHTHTHTHVHIHTQTQTQTHAAHTPTNLSMYQLEALPLAMLGRRMMWSCVFVQESGCFGVMLIIMHNRRE